MQILPKGVTGFGCSLDQAVTVERFKAQCYAVARQIHGKVLRICPSRVHNFHEARMTTSYQRDIVDVLCNAHYPIVAFTRQHAEGATWPDPPSWRDGKHHFVDCPDLANGFAAEFTVLRAAEAGATATDELVAELDEGERHWMRYWKASRVGDIIFNDWD